MFSPELLSTFLQPADKRRWRFDAVILSCGVKHKQDSTERAVGPAALTINPFGVMSHSAGSGVCTSPALFVQQRTIDGIC